MEQDALFENLRQQGCRQHEKSAKTGKTRFEWRDETIYIPPPSGTNYSSFEIQMIGRLIEKQTANELSLFVQSVSSGGVKSIHQPEDSDG